MSYVSTFSKTAGQDALVADFAEALLELDSSAPATAVMAGTLASLMVKCASELEAVGESGALADEILTDLEAELA